MSAKNLRYSHAEYCTERSQEPQPVEIPVPNIEIKKATALRDRKTVPVLKNQSQTTRSRRISPNIRRGRSAATAAAASLKTTTRKARDARAILEKHDE
jgi:hypothetical protein